MRRDKENRRRASDWKPERLMTDRFAFVECNRPSGVQNNRRGALRNGQQFGQVSGPPDDVIVTSRLPYILEYRVNEPIPEKNSTFPGSSFAHTAATMAS